VHPRHILLYDFMSRCNAGVLVSRRLAAGLQLLKPQLLLEG